MRIGNTTTLNQLPEKSEIQELTDYYKSLQAELTKLCKQFNKAADLATRKHLLEQIKLVAQQISNLLKNLASLGVNINKLKSQ